MFTIEDSYVSFRFSSDPFSCHPHVVRHGMAWLVWWDRRLLIVSIAINYPENHNHNLLSFTKHLDRNERSAPIRRFDVWTAILGHYQGTQQQPEGACVTRYLSAIVIDSFHLPQSKQPPTRGRVRRSAWSNLKSEHPDQRSAARRTRSYARLNPD